MINKARQRRKSKRIAPAGFQKLTEDLCKVLRQAYESFLVWEHFGDLISSAHRGDPDDPRAFFFQPFNLALVGATFDSFVVNLYKFYDNRSHELATLVDVGVRHGGLDAATEKRLRTKIERIESTRVKAQLDSLRNRSIGHHNIFSLTRSPLTAIDPTPKQIREHFVAIAEILQICAVHARFNHLPFSYDQFENQIKSAADVVIDHMRLAPQKVVRT